MKTRTPSPHEFLKRATTVASYYGFTPLDQALKTYKCTDKKAKSALELPPAPDAFAEELSSFTEAAYKTTIPKIESPLQIYTVYSGSRRGKRRSGKPSVRLGLTVLGIDKSVAEALILRSSLAILEEVGMDETSVEINSVGDKDTMQKFIRELNAYLRKNMTEMPLPCRDALRRDALEALQFLLEKKHPLLDHAPRPMQFLSDTSRRHLREVIEFLELCNIPYEVNTELVGNRDYHSQTIFEIKEKQKDQSPEHKSKDTSIRVRGGRCDELIKKVFHTKLPTVSVVIERVAEKMQALSWRPPLMRRPKVYFIQLGTRAKTLSLSIIETLRKAKIPLRQAIGNDSLVEQLKEAQTLGIPKALIMGQREALDGTIIVRDMETHSQTTIALEDLPQHLKSIKI